MKRIILSLVFISSVFAFASDSRIQQKEFLLKGRRCMVSVIAGLSGSDIYIDTGKKKNITLLIPGENLCPNITVRENNYFATWLNYKKGDVGLGFYNPVSNFSRIVVRRGFRFISGASKVVFNNNSPEFILFRGIRDRDNEDIFLFRISDEKLIRVTDTAGNEKEIIVHEQSPAGKGKIRLQTKTLYRNYIYEIYKSDLRVKKLLDTEIERKNFRSNPAITSKGLNTIVAFGDSITWGKMRMNDLQGEYHPELTYWFKTSEYLSENYGTTYTVNLGVNADKSQKGVDRMDDDFKYLSAYYLLVLFGTNDVGGALFSPASSAENLRWIIENARDNYGMYPIISTVPPQKKYVPGVQLFKDETEELNTLIITMAVEEGIPYIDTYSIFMTYADGWEALLEDTKGNHPNPTGHQLMADLIVPKILAVPPASASVTDISGSTNSVQITTSENYEFDFDHYEVKFGYYPGKLDFDASFNSNIFSLIRFPAGLKIRDTIYFKVRSVDKDGNGSDFSVDFMTKFTD